MAFNSLVLSFFHAVSVYLLLPLFTLLSSYISRLKTDVNSLQKHGREMVLPESSEAEKKRSNQSEIPVPNFSLKFKFLTIEEFSRIPTPSGNNLGDPKASHGHNKNEFASGKILAVRAIVEEPAETFPVKQNNLDKNSGHNLEVDNERKAKVFSRFDRAETRKTDAIKLVENGVRKTLSGNKEEEFPGNQACPNESLFRSSDKTGADSFLSNRDFRQKLVVECKNWEPGLKRLSGFEENQEFPDQCLPDKINSGFLSEKDFNDHNTMPAKEHPCMSDNSNGTNKLESLWEHQELIEQLKMELRKVRDTGLPTILEESESPRILTDDLLKPWKIDDNLQYEDCMDEVNKFYKSYIETMRKFDILNYQKMYAIGFLQLKDPFQPTLQQKPSPPTLKSFVSRNLWLFKHKRHSSDPVRKFVVEMQGDLEVVYVGQMCLSWEFLHWQYTKVSDLWNSDPHRIHQYNEVSGEFQQFQVLVQRFLEDEGFQGPRVQSYVKSRCILRNLLQVPAIREDDPKDKKKQVDKRRDDREDDEYLITSEMLVEIVEESIQTLWRFVRSDKDCNILQTNGHKKHMSQLHNPHDHNLLLEVKQTFLKKERKMRDSMRREKCILRRFQLQTKEDDDYSEQVLFFFAQVDMKLVCRVLNMSKVTRDQLIWCQNKLSRISFVNRKINVEPAFLLFPAC